MTAIRRHLASWGLTLAVCHLLIQVLVPAALCCEKTLPGKRAAAADCCPAGSHAGRVCPMHASSRVKQAQQPSDCHAQATVNLHDLLIALTSGGVLPSPSALDAPAGFEAAPTSAEPAATTVPSHPPGPPPRA